jgi:TfoX/Sxy family transcriptional regulator of competence genes
MTYSKEVEITIDGLIESWPDIEKKKMFGGVGYLTGGNMCFGIWQEYLIVRTGPELANQKLTDQNVRPFDLTGKQMKGWIMVGRDALETDAELLDWLETGRSFAGSLPGKP